jgi:PD-(D/E)XK endonuclease
MKKKGKRKPKILDKKLRGEWAEMVFMARATERGLPVSKPWGDARSYDFVVGRPGHFVAVQVKSTIEDLGGRYLCTVRGGKSRLYQRGDFDFLAAYVIFEDAWYIIPMEEVLGKQHLSLYPNAEAGDYEGYREAWKLLGPDCGEREKGIDIQACAEEFLPDWVEDHGNLVRYRNLWIRELK